MNLFATARSRARTASGQFIKDLHEHFPEDERLVTSEIKDKDAIIDSIRDFLGKGK